MVGKTTRTSAADFWRKRGKMPTHITGAQWGDEGKGKLVDVGAQKVDIIVKTNGGANAGHTVENEYGEFKLHLMPGGFANPKVLNIIGTHVVVDPLQLLSELDDVQSHIPFPVNLLISNKAALVMPWHKIRDGVREESKGKGSIGTTRQGVGEAYADKALREGFLVGDLVKKDFKERFLREAQRQENLIHSLSGKTKKIKYLDVEASLKDYLKAAKRLAPMIGNTQAFIRQAYEEGKVILGEAGQAALLDLDFGSYPYVTSSHPGVTGFMLSTGLNSKEVGRVIGTTKAYMTRVGNGPMPSELLNKMGEYLREKGHEYGATTGRPRRTGWFDAVVTKYGVQTAGITELAITKSDVLDELDSIEICVGYEIKGKEYKNLPDSDPEVLEKAKPIYKKMKGWKKDTSKVRDYNDFPKEARDYFAEIERLVGVPISIISVGPSREAIVYR